MVSCYRNWDKPQPDRPLGLYADLPLARLFFLASNITVLMFVLLGTIRATVMVETLLAGVNMEEMLYEIREHCCGMNAGRWDYIFSAIKRFSRKSDCVLPDRKQVCMGWSDH